MFFIEIHSFLRLTQFLTPLTSFLLLFPLDFGRFTFAYRVDFSIDYCGWLLP